jgi:hypothetical protein
MLHIHVLFTYIQHKFIYFAKPYHENHFEPKYFYTSAIVGRLLFLERFVFFNI